MRKEALSVILLFGFTALVSAQTPAATDLKDSIKSVDSKEFLKLRGGTKADAANAISNQLRAKELNQQRTYVTKVEKVESWRFPNSDKPGWRIVTENEDVKSGSVKLGVVLNIYVREDPENLLLKLKRGQMIEASGRITRFDITTVNEPILNVDLHTGTIALKGR